MELRLLVCVACDAEFVLDRQCYRGHQYCSPECAQQARDKSLERAKATYEASSKGKRNHRERENRRRQKLKRTEEVDARKLTDQSSPDPGQAVTIEDRAISSTSMSSAEPVEDTASLETGSQGWPSEAMLIVEPPDTEPPAAPCCRDCGATGRITRWEVRPGSGRRGVWTLMARLGARGRQSRGPVEPGGTNWISCGGANDFG
jgi:hypothetical protein